MSEQMRKEFEAWAISRRFAVDRDPHLRGNPYTSVWTTGGWEAWQAALATQPKAPQGTGLYFDRGEIEYQKTEGLGEGLFLVSANQTAFYNTEILAAPTETPEAGK